MMFRHAFLVASVLLVRVADAQDATTFHHDIAPLLQKNCVSCHRAPGGNAPFPLRTYADARRRATQLVTVTQSGYMPPWKTTTPGFHGQRGLNDAEKTTLKRWAESGATEGKPPTEAGETPKAPTVTDWPLGQPDKILAMPREYTLAASTSEVSRCFVIPTGLNQDRRVRTIAFHPSNPRLVRYASIYADTSGQGRQQEAVSGAVGYFGFASGLRPTPAGSLWDWSPGAANPPLPDGAAIFLPKGTDLILQLRFHATGKPEAEKMQIGLYFADKTPLSRTRHRAPGRRGVVLAPPVHRNAG